MFVALATSLFALIMISELSLQVFYRVKSGAWLWENSAFRIGYTQPVSDRRGYALRPGYRDANAGISISESGFRRTPSSENARTPIIACIGDSVPFGAGVRDEETYPFLLSAVLKEKGVTVGVVNAGVPSYNLRQSFDRLKKEVLTQDGRGQVLLVTVDAANDISLLTYYGANWTPDVTWAEVRWSGTWGISSVFTRVALAHYWSKLVSSIDRKGQHGGIDGKSISSLKKDEMLSHVRHLLHTELAALEKRGVQVVLLPINPFYYQVAGRERNASLRQWASMAPYVEGWDDLIGRYNDVLKSVSLQYKNAYFFDMRLIMDLHDRDALYLDYIHYSPRGNSLFVSALLDFLDEKSVIPRQAVSIESDPASVDSLL